MRASPFVHVWPKSHDQLREAPMRWPYKTYHEYNALNIFVDGSLVPAIRSIDLRSPSETGVTVCSQVFEGNATAHPGEYRFTSCKQGHEHASCIDELDHQRRCALVPLLGDRLSQAAAAPVQSTVSIQYIKACSQARKTP